METQRKAERKAVRALTGGLSQTMNGETQLRSVCEAGRFGCERVVAAGEGSREAAEHLF